MELFRRRTGAGIDASSLLLATTLAVLAGSATATDAGAQIALDPDIGPPAFMLVGGAFIYDLGRHGEGTVPIGGLRVDFPLGDHISIGPAVSYTEYTADEVDAGATDRVRLGTLEFLVNALYPVGRFSPYVGISTGATADFRDDRGSEDFLVISLSAAAGVSIEVGRGWSLLGEARARGLNEIGYDALEVLLGFSTSF